MAIDWNDPNLQTKDGRKAKLLKKLERLAYVPLYAVLITSDKGFEEVCYYRENGYFGVNPECPSNLHNPPKEEWVNVVKRPDGTYFVNTYLDNDPFTSEKEAKEAFMPNGYIPVAVRIR